MSIQEIWLGQIGPYLYDDGSVIEVNEQELPAEGITVTGQMRILEDPTDDYHVIRKIDSANFVLPQDLGISDSPTFAGITLTDAPLAITSGGTGADSASAARVNLGLEIGVNVQAYDLELAALAGLSSAANQLPYFTGVGTASLATLTAFARTLLDDSNLGELYATLSLGTIVTQNSNAVTITGGTVSGITDLAVADGGTGASTASGARTNLGLVIGTDVQAYSATLFALAAGMVGYGIALVLSASAADARTTLGLGSIATQNSSSVTITGGSVTGITDIAVADGGTGASNAANARTNLGLVIGTDVQAYDAELSALAGLVSAADRVPYFTGSGTAALATLTNFARTFLDDADAAAVKVTLGLTIGTDVQAYDAELAALASLTSAADKLPYFTGSGTAALTTLTSFIRDLLDDADASIARTTLGVVIGTDVQAHSSVLDSIVTNTLPSVFEHVLDIPPNSAHAKDDEFNGSSLDAKWTNPLTSGSGLDLLVTVANGWLRFEPNTSGTASTSKRGGFGIRQAAPTGAFSISARILSVSPTATDTCRVGIFVARTANTTATVLGFETSLFRQANGFGTTGYSESAEWSGYDGYDTFVSPGAQQPSSGYWYKISWDGTSVLTLYYSSNGYSWHTLGTRTSQSQPDRIGIVMYGNSQDIRADHALICKWFRVTEP